MEAAEPRSPKTILDYWDVVFRYRWMIVGMVLASTFVTGIVSKFFLPHIYEAKATLYPVREDSLGGSGISLGGAGKEKGGAMSLAMDVMGGRSSGPTLLDTLQVILDSRLIAEAVVDELNLMSYYGTQSKSAAMNAVRGETTVRGTNYKTLEITVASKDPKMAAEIANTYFLLLDRVYKQHTMTSTKRNRLFIEARLAEKGKKLAEAEEALKEYQTEHRTLEVTVQADAVMGEVANLHAQIVGLEVELAALREYATLDHPMINQLQAQIQELRNQLDKMEQNPLQVAGLKKKSRLPISKKTFPGLDEAPSLALELLRLTRQVKVEESVYGMLVGMLEQAKIAEVRDVPTIQIMDAAVPPEHRSKPRSIQNIQVAGALSLVFGIILAFFLDNLLNAVRMRAAVQEPPASVVGDLAQGGGNGNGKAEVRPVSPREAERLHG